jgi:hypothetical protein
MSHRIEVDSAFTFLADLGDRVWWTPTVRIVHTIGIKNEQNVDVYHFFLDGEAFSPALKAKKDRIHDFHASLLLASMTKEFTSKHRNIWVQPLLRLVRFSIRVECVAPMNAENPFPSLRAMRLSRARSWPGCCRACLDQIPSREEEECVVLTQVAIEHAPILRSDDIETVCPTKLCEFGFREELPLASSLTTSCSNPEDLLKTGPSAVYSCCCCSPRARRA